MQLKSPADLNGDQRSLAASALADKRSNHPLLIALSLAIVAVCFAVDLLTPNGATPAIGYCVVPLLVVQTRRRWFILGMMGLCTFLTWVVYLIEPLTTPVWMSIFERSMVTGVLWFSFVLVWQRTEALARLAEQAQALAQANNELSRSNQELDAFAAVASHDIRGPLATTGMFADLLANSLRGKIERDCAEWLALIQSEVQRMHSIVESLLQYSRFNREHLRLVECDCEDILATVLDALKADLIAHGAEVTHDPLPRLMADPIQLAVLLQNLIGNSIKYRSGARPKIHLSARADGEGWKFSLEDNGIGISPEDSKKIFRLFQRGEDSQETKGLGIGLATCKRIAELHGGRIWVESVPGRGSTFYITIADRLASSHPSSRLPEESEQARSATA
jgi:signal transduction histidine kinase